MWEVSHDFFSLRNKSRVILLPPNFISWQLKSSTENLTFQKDWFSRFANTMNQNFDFIYRWRNKILCNWREINHLTSNNRCQSLKNKLLISTNLLHPESAPDSFLFYKSNLPCLICSLNFILDFFIYLNCCNCIFNC